MMDPTNRSALERVPARIVPLFPLPNVWLFPAIVLPLHVFEQRYRQMVEDCLDGPGRIVLLDNAEFALYAIAQEFADQRPEIQIAALAGDAK